MNNNSKETGSKNGMDEEYLSDSIREIEKNLHKPEHPPAPKKQGGTGKPAVSLPARIALGVGGICLAAWMIYSSSHEQSASERFMSTQDASITAHKIQTLTAPTPFTIEQAVQSTPTYISDSGQSADYSSDLSSDYVWWKKSEVINSSSIDVQLQKGDILYLSGSHYRVGGTVCENNSQSGVLCVYLHEAAGDETVTIDNLVSGHAWLGITEDTTIEDALLDREPYFWNGSNCGDTCTLVKIYAHKADGTTKYGEAILGGDVIWQQ